jgi:dihydrofolate reductase
VACAQGRVIGQDNRLPWHLPEDLRHFRQTTLGRAIIMGRRTWDSIGRPLPGRTTVVLSRQPAWQAPGCLHADSLEKAIALARAHCPGEVFVVGGEAVYREALPMASRVLMTEIALSVPGDAHFPALDPQAWVSLTRAEHTSATGIAYAIIDYRRR